MFEQHIIVSDNSLTIRKRVIPWDDIVGVRRFDSSLFYQMGTGTVSCQLLLRGGKTVRINSNLKVQNMEPQGFLSKYENKFKEYFTLLEIISKKAPNINSNLSSWIEWRFVLPPAIIQLVILLYGVVVSHQSPFDMVDKAIIGCLPGVALGLIWEREARKNLWK